MKFFDKYLARYLLFGKIAAQKYIFFNMQKNE